MSNNPSRVQPTTDATDTENGDSLQVFMMNSNIAFEKTDFSELHEFQKIASNCVNEALDEVLSSDMQWDIRPGFIDDAMKSFDHSQPLVFSTIPVSSSDEMVSNDEIEAVLGKYSPAAVDANITALMLPEASTLTSSLPLVQAPSLAAAASTHSPSSVFSSRSSTPRIRPSSPKSGPMPPPRAPQLSVSTPSSISRSTSVAASSRSSTPQTQVWSSRSGSMPPPRALSAAPSHSHLRQQNMASEPVVDVATPLQLPRPASTSTSSSSSRSSISTGQLRVPIPTLSSSTPQLGVLLPTIPSDSMWPQLAPESTDEDESLWGEPEPGPMAVDDGDEFPPSLYPMAESTGEGLGLKVPFCFSRQPASDYNAVPSSSPLALTAPPTTQPSPRTHTNAASGSSTVSYPRASGPTRNNNSKSKQRGSWSAAAGPSSTKGKGKARDTSTSMPIQSMAREDLTYAELAALNRGSAAKMPEAEMTAIAYAVGYNPKNFQRVYTYNTPNGSEKVTFPSGWTPNYALLLRTSRAPSTGPIRTESRQQIPATPYTRPERVSLQPDLFPGTAPIPSCRPSNQRLSPAETLGQTQQAATAANATCRWEGCSAVLQIGEIWEHIKTDHRFECRMADVGLKCRWVGSDGKQCTKQLMGRSMKNHVVRTHAKPTVFR
ncbi:hypothetical protein R3P38DRAFT_3438049 [Favolaschia claudopus]|uniref:C2H2-type domain-containing protein n=1 Tax=Favolaschia claudopus TaxID=2862362 RepID=A0AAV9ZS61_9AGAR